MNHNELSYAIIGAAIEVHKELGPGKPEAAYERALCHELELRGISARPQKPLPVVYKGVKLDCGYRLDVLVENVVVVEVKSVTALAAIHDAQGLTYLKLGGWKLCLLINFNVAVLKEGLRRLVLGLEEEGRFTAEARRAQREEQNLEAEAVSMRASDLRGDAETNEISQGVVSAAMEVHRHLGPGLLESAYQVCLCHELTLRRIPFAQRTLLPLSYKGRALDQNAEVGFVAAGRVVVQAKALDGMEPVHEADLLSQLRLGGWSQGLLLNFNTRSLRDGIRRLLNDR
jgi:GxxExxY protein